jgi:hypothetical protein
MIRKYENFKEIPSYISKQLNKCGLKYGYMLFYWRCFKQIKKKSKDFIFDIFVKELDEEIVGACYSQNLLYRCNDFINLDIFIKKKFRNKGYAFSILEHIANNTEYKKLLCKDIGLYHYFDKNYKDFYLFKYDDGDEVTNKLFKYEYIGVKDIDEKFIYK